MRNIPLNQRLVVAADFVPDATGREGVRGRVLTLANDLKDTGVIIKVNSALRACGYVLIKELHDRGLQVAADLKLVDIRDTLTKDGALLAEEKPEFVTVMGNAGVAGMAALCTILSGTELWVVTVLTSLDNEASKDIFGCNAQEGVLRFARLAKQAGIGSLILSPKEAKIIRADPDLCDLCLNSPGIRYPWSETGDQVRFLTAGEAVKAGIDRVVVGRPILDAHSNSDPQKPQSRRQAMEWILQDIEANLPKS